MLAKLGPEGLFFFFLEVQSFRHFWQFGFKMWSKENRSVVPGEQLHYTITRIIQNRSVPEYCGHYVGLKELIGQIFCKRE